MKMTNKFNQFEETVCLIDPARMEGHNEYILFEVVGTSMQCDKSTSIARGTKLYAKKLRPHLYDELSIFKDIPFWIIKLQDSELAILKEIIDYNRKSGMILCKSLNDNFKNVEIFLSDVEEIYYVVFKMENVTNIYREPFDIEIYRDIFI